MIDARELRIGSWYLWLNDLPSQVAVIKKDADMTEAFPIPLTPEVLSKTNICQAFTTDPQQPHYSEKFFIGNCAIHHHTEARGRYMFYGDEDLRFEVKYLHQLQNLIFITTGEELTVNL